jgi:hypothetical protein
MCDSSHFFDSPEESGDQEKVMKSLGYFVAVCVIAALSDCKCDKTHPDTEKALALRNEVLDALAERLSECTPTEKASVKPLLQLEPIARFDIARGLADGRVALSADNAQACLSHIRTAPCEGARRSLTGDTSPCAKLFVAQSQSGGKCLSDVDCTAGLFCNVDDIRCPGTCAARSGEKAVCDERTPCAAGLACTCVDANCKEKTCRVPSTTGVSCGKQEQAPCADDHFCVPLGQPKAMTCQPRAKDGESCKSVDGCAIPLKCSSGSCRRPRMIGEACQPGEAECTDLAVCKGEGQSAQCVAWGTVGSTCGPLADGREYAGCIGSSCELDPKTGAGKCVPYKQHGEVCSPGMSIDFVCGPGRCDTLMRRCVYPCDVKQPAN